MIRFWKRTGKEVKRCLDMQLMVFKVFLPHLLRPSPPIHIHTFTFFLFSLVVVSLLHCIGIDLDCAFFLFFLLANFT